MAPRFTVIQGGLSGAPGCTAEPGSERADVPATGWRVDLHRPGAVDAASVSAWRALLIRNAVTDPLRDPDHLLPLAQHRPAGRRVAIALVWNRDAQTGGEALQGVVPLAMPRSIWDGRARPWQPAEAEATALVGRAAAEAVDRALKARLGALRGPVRLVGMAEPPRLVPTIRPALVNDRPTHASAAPKPIPCGDVIGVRPYGWEAPIEETHLVSGPEAVRDAVETFLALDARTARRPIIADPAEASLVRVVSRLFGRRGALRVEFLRRAGEIVGGTLHLGSGAASVPWRRARA